jgi:pimeloyl-ACP methyl ester carboxylesterase
MLGRLFGILLGLVGLAALVAVGGYFALRRADIPYETLAAKYESAASRYVDLPDGVHMHYRDEGAQGGPIVLLIHGFSASLHTWEPWVQRLGEDYRVITLDLPGHGLTRAPAGYQGTIDVFRDEVAAFLQTQGLTDFAIGGNSMGGHVAWEYALAHPEHVNALLLVDSAGWPEAPRAEGDNGPIIFKLLANPITAAILRDLDNSRLIRQGLGSAFPAHPELVDDVMVARYSELSRAPGHRDIILDLMRDTPPAATHERLAALHMPVLVMHGTEDNLIPFTHAQQFHDSIAGAELAALEGIGHAPQEEVPDQSATIASEFLYRVVEGSALAAE